LTGGSIIFPNNGDIGGGVVSFEEVMHDGADIDLIGVNGFARPPKSG
jgi:hypothetical protein